MKLITVNELCERYGLCHGTIYSYVYRKKIPHIRLGNRMLRFDPEIIEAWIKAGEVFPVGKRENAEIGGTR